MFSTRTHWSLETNPLARAIEARRAQGLPIIDLTESNPTHCGFDYGEDLLREFLNIEALLYAPDPRGPAAARAAVAEYYAERGVEVDPRRLFLTASTSEAYSYVFRLLANPGDVALIPRPGYPLFSFLTQLNDVEAVEYRLSYLPKPGTWNIDRASIERALSGRAGQIGAVLAVNPNNPTGSYAHLEEADFLASLCHRAGAAIIADEVFWDYSFNEEMRFTFAGERRALTFTLSGISKISALPQMKCAWILVSGPEALVAQAMERLEVIADTYLSLSTPVACALPALLRARRKLQPQVLERARGNLARVDDALKAAPKSAIRRLAVEGGWYVILQLPDRLTDEEWCVKLLSEEGVLAHPGHFYDFETDGLLALSLLPHPEAFSDGISRLLACIERQL